MNASLDSSSNLSWAARPGRELLRLSWPIAVSTISYSAMNLVGGAFVARVGAAEVAGVGLAGAISFGLWCFAIGVLRGLKTLVSQAIGAGRAREVDNYLGVGVLFALGMGAVALIVAEILAPILAVVTPDPAIGAAAATYLRIRALSAPMLLVYVALRETRWGEGDTHAPMRASLLGNLTNFTLDVVLIVGLGWGVLGAAIAAVAGNAVELARLAWPMRRRLVGITWRTSYARAIWQQGAATGLQFLMEVGAFLLLTAIVSQMSAADAAAHHLVLQLTHVSFLPAHALAEAASVLVGNAVGASREDLLRPVARRALALGAAYTGLCTVVFGVGAPAIAALLVGDRPAVIAVTISLIHVSALFLIADAGNVIARGVLRGAGDVVYPALVGVITAWLLTPPTAWGLGLALGWGAVGGWIGLTAEIIIGASILWWRVLRGGWADAAAGSRRRVLSQRTAVGGDAVDASELSLDGHVRETIECEAMNYVDYVAADGERTGGRLHDRHRDRDGAPGDRGPSAAPRRAAARRDAATGPRHDPRVTGTDQRARRLQGEIRGMNRC
ncbi:MAG TPA: MATE family efflux transporter [Kofleriaceae bacterium]|nr:MATE family efflux transporter [Kofleriaceae bacterium]